MKPLTRKQHQLLDLKTPDGLYRIVRTSYDQIAKERFDKGGWLTASDVSWWSIFLAMGFVMDKLSDEELVIYEQLVKRVKQEQDEEERVSFYATLSPLKRVVKATLTVAQVAIGLCFVVYGFYADDGSGSPAFQFSVLPIPDLGDLIAGGLIMGGIYAIQALKRKLGLVKVEPDPQQLYEMYKRSRDNISTKKTP